MASIFSRVKFGDAAQKEIAKELLRQNKGVFPCCCHRIVNGVVSCDRFQVLTKKLCLACQREVEGVLN